VSLQHVSALKGHLQGVQHILFTSNVNKMSYKM